MKKWWIMSLWLLVMMVVSSCASNSDKLRFATDASFAPMEFMDKDQIKGFDIDFIEAVMQEAGLAFSVHNTGWDTMLESVKQGKEFDAGISSVSITEDRNATYDFSIPYFESINMILTKEGSSITTATDLKDLKVAVQNATTADIIMTELMGKNNGKIKRFESITVAMLELENDGVDAVVADNTVIGEYIRNHPEKKFKAINDTQYFKGEFYGVLLPKGSSLKPQMDQAIKRIFENGRYAEIYERWFGQKPDMKRLYTSP